MLGVVSLGDVERYGLRSAALETKSGTYVAPDRRVARRGGRARHAEEGRRAVRPRPGRRPQVRHGLPGHDGRLHGGQAANLAEEDAAKVAQFIRVSTTEGQQAGHRQRRAARRLPADREVRRHREAATLGRSGSPTRSRSRPRCRPRRRPRRRRRTGRRHRRRRRSRPSRRGEPVDRSVRRRRAPRRRSRRPPSRSRCRRPRPSAPRLGGRLLPGLLRDRAARRRRGQRAAVLRPAARDRDRDRDPARGLSSRSAASTAQPEPPATAAAPPARRPPAAPDAAPAPPGGQPTGRVAVLSSACTMVALVCLWVARPDAVPERVRQAARPGPALRRSSARTSRPRRRRSGRSRRPASRWRCSRIPRLRTLAGRGRGHRLGRHARRAGPPAQDGAPGPGRHVGRDGPGRDVRRRRSATSTELRGRRRDQGRDGAGRGVLRRRQRAPGRRPATPSRWRRVPPG